MMSLPSSAASAHERGEGLQQTPGEHLSGGVVRPQGRLYFLEKRECDV